MEENLPKNWILPALAFGFILLVSFLFIAGKPLAPKNITETQTPAPSPIKNVSLSISPTKLDLKTGTKTTLPISIESPDKVSAVEIHLTYDPKVININDISPMEFFESPKILTKKIDNEKGEVTFIIGTLPAKSGAGQIAQLSLSAISVGKTQIDFSQNSQAAIIGSSKNALGKTTGVLITVLGK